jgi:multiple sugar transport system permease protein
MALLVLGMFLFPVFWLYLSAFKSDAELNTWPPTFWPHNFQPHIFDVLQEVDVARYLKNSLIIALGGSLITLVLGVGASWVLARFKSVWLDFTLFTIIVLQMLPGALMATPLYVLFSNMGLLNTQLSVMLASAAKSIPFFIIILRPSFLGIPKELEEAARIDGCKGFQLLIRIVLPLVRNGVFIAFMLVFMGGYGEYVFSRSFLLDSELYPASIGIIIEFFGQYSKDIPGAMSFGVIYLTPVLALFVLIQRQLVSGLTAGSVK